MHLRQASTKEISFSAFHPLQLDLNGLLALPGTILEDQDSNLAVQNAHKSPSKLEASTSSHNKPETVEGFPTCILEIDIPSAPVSSRTHTSCKKLSNYKQCEMNIVVNINQSYAFLLSGKRSSYQKILSLEKVGMNVVERDIFLPIDLILSPAVCLIWYTQEKLGGSDLSSQTVHCTCIEGITNDIMKALSFSFRICIMIFEGPAEFVAECMQMFGYLHAAAVGLDMQLQCFISSSSSTTDRIIADCILEMKGSRKTTFPAMLEATTLAESFLTECASMNALTAHAILSCGVELCEFLFLTIEEQLRLTELFDVPERSLRLFKTQCQSGASGKVHKALRRVDLEDQQSINQSKIKGFTYKAGSFVKDSPNQCRLKQHIGLDERHTKTATRQAVVPLDDFPLPDCGPWPGENIDYQDEEDACWRSVPEDMGFTWKSGIFVHSPEQKHRTPVVRHHDTKLKRTMDLILKRHTSSSAKDCFQAVKEGKTSPGNKDAKKRWFGLDESSLPEGWLCSPVDVVLSPELDPLSKFDKANATDGSDSPKSWCSFQPTSLRSQVLDKATEDILEYQPNEDPNRHSKKEYPVEFANETRAYLKRKLSFESPATTAKRLKKHPAGKKQRSLKSNLFDKYRYDSKGEQSREKSGRVSGQNSMYTPQKYHALDVYMEKRLKTLDKTPLNLHRDAYMDSPGHPFSRKQDARSSPPQLKGSWTPLDKRAEKVLSFAKKGNDCQSRLVWESSRDASKRSKSLSPFHKSPVRWSRG